MMPISALYLEVVFVLILSIYMCSWLQSHVHWIPSQVVCLQIVEYLFASSPKQGVFQTGVEAELCLLCLSLGMLSSSKTGP